VPGDRVDDDSAWQEFHFTPPCVTEEVERLRQCWSNSTTHIWLDVVNASNALISQSNARYECMQHRRETKTQINCFTYIVDWRGVVGGFVSQLYFPDHLFIGRLIMIMYAFLLGNYIFKVSADKM
jgi:hypothetical protein